ncbi:MAG: hypothetical protein GY847_14435 [Proteobacteria bacterium]|nr:hypothetical protein [Pseudomonadota bacterium]
MSKNNKVKVRVIETDDCIAPLNHICGVPCADCRFDLSFRHKWVAIINGAEIDSSEIDWPGDFGGYYTRPHSARRGFIRWYANVIGVNGDICSESWNCRHDMTCFECQINHAIYAVEFVK